ncbi:hypothetical protein G9A89_003956 [Geosiphon pyriformis]|nr:hypothetical protein G9A89_003956 [Geosiphon pyriformis]
MVTSQEYHKIPSLRYHWTSEEKQTLIELYKKYGSNWKLISQKYFQSRTIQALRSKFYSLSTGESIVDDRLTKKAQKWTLREDEELQLAAKKYLIHGKINWRSIFLTGCFPKRSAKSLANRYHGVLTKPKRGPWSRNEDEQLRNLVQTHGEKWTKISHILQRPPKLIRQKYIRYFAPGIKIGRWTPEEFKILAEEVGNLNENWNEIQELIPGRPLSDIKRTYYNSPKVQRKFNSGKWNDIEINTLNEAFKRFGKNLHKLSEAVITRSPKQSGDSPEILGNRNNAFSRVNQRWSLEEIKVLFEAYKVFGPKWELISQKQFPLRIAGSLKDKWYDLRANGGIINQKFILTWAPEEDKELYIAVIQHSFNKKVDWKAILFTGRFPGRSNQDLCNRYYNVLAQSKRGPWTKEEDEKLLSLAQSHGKRWTEISHSLQRPACSIQSHYNNFLAPGIKKSRWTNEEFHQLAKAFQVHGENWEQIQQLLPGRSLHQIRCYCRRSPKIQIKGKQTQ